MFTKKERIQEFQESHGGLRSRPDQVRSQPLERGPSRTALHRASRAKISGEMVSRVRVGDLREVNQCTD
jgi:hypothetical protein